MTHLRTRIARLSGRTGDKGCSLCGHHPGGQVAFVLDTIPADAGAPIETEYCPACGDVTRFSIAFDRAGAEGRWE